MDAENMTFESVAAEQALQRQAADLVTAYLGHAPQDEKPLAVEVSTQAPLVDPLAAKSSLPRLGDQVTEPGAPPDTNFPPCSRGLCGLLD